MRKEVAIKLEVGDGKDVYFRLEGREDNRQIERVYLFIKNDIIKTMVVPSRAKNELPGVNNKLGLGWGCGSLTSEHRYDSTIISPPEGGGSILPEAKRLFALFVENWEVALTDQANNHKGYKPYTIK